MNIVSDKNVQHHLFSWVDIKRQEEHVFFAYSMQSLATTDLEGQFVQSRMDISGPSVSIFNFIISFSSGAINKKTQRLNF